MMSRQRQLKAEILSTKNELLQTSAQDQFAKWAKLRRSVDKGHAELEKISCVLCVCCIQMQHMESPEATSLISLLLDGELSSNKSAFSFRFNSFMWILTTGLQFLIGFWYRKSAVFYVPEGWFGPFTWCLALPFAPKGNTVYIRLSDA